jgi:hypothetical protein
MPWDRKARFYIMFLFLIKEKSFPEPQRRYDLPRATEIINERAKN